MPAPKTLFEKIWEKHLVPTRDQAEDSPSILYIDRHLVHEVTSPQAFSGLRQRGLSVHQPGKTFATVDHGIPTRIDADGSPKSRLNYADELSRKQILQLEANCAEFGITCFGLESPHQGVIHIIAPEQGLTLPGMTIVCGDSHTATHGAFGALAFGIGTSEVEHVLASQCLLQHKPKSMRVRFEGMPTLGVSAKDLILAVINKIGVDGGTGYVIEYSGMVISNMSMEERMTICNMSIEGGARAGLIAPDETTFAWLKDLPHAPKGEAWQKSLETWRLLVSDADAAFDAEVVIDVASLEPMITYGTNPSMSIPINGKLPTAHYFVDADARKTYEKALAYMGLQAGQTLHGHTVDVVFIGSCTNGRISDLRQAAQIMQGKKVAAGVRVLVVPGSHQVKAQAEAEGLDHIFIDAGAEWRQPGCSMCIAMNGDQIEAGQYAVSTSNRNFEGRQGKGGRTMLASPYTAAAAAITGVVTDPRQFL